VYRYQAQAADDQTLSVLLKQLAEDHPRWGLRKMHLWLRNNGFSWNLKRV
jgi:hypothetical protein